MPENFGPSDTSASASMRPIDLNRRDTRMGTHSYMNLLITGSLRILCASWVRSSMRSIGPDVVAPRGLGPDARSISKPRTRLRSCSAASGSGTILARGVSYLLSRRPTAVGSMLLPGSATGPNKKYWGSVDPKRQANRSRTLSASAKSGQRHISGGDNSGATIRSGQERLSPAPKVRRIRINCGTAGLSHLASQVAGELASIGTQ